MRYRIGILVVMSMGAAACSASPPSSAPTTAATPATTASGSVADASPPASAKRDASAPVEVAIQLDTHVVDAGTPIDGEALLTNTTSKAITVQACAANGWLFVGLANTRIAFDPLNGSVACGPSVKLPPGVNRFPVTVETTYQTCNAPAEATAASPACLSKGGPIPPLPPGRYTTRTIISGLPAGSQYAPRLTVTILGP